MAAQKTYDVIIVGGGPAGSTCAAFLNKAGLNAILLDKGSFPRVKLCAGWLSAPVWEVLEILPANYPADLWEFKQIHVRFRGRNYTLKSGGYFIRRYEFDDFLLKRSQVPVLEDFMVRQIEKDEAGYWVVNDQIRAKYLVGAGGTNCPVARALFPKPDNLPCGTQEKEFAGSLAEVAASRAGADGEPEILLHDDMKGYSWNIPKGPWLNVGTGTKVAREVLPAWGKARNFFEGNGSPGTIPVSLQPELNKMKGHGYVGFHPNQLKNAYADNAFLVGDALGLAQPMTGEGILPAVLSGKLCALAIAGGNPATYLKTLRTHPIISDYQLLFGMQTLVRKIINKDGPATATKANWLDRVIVSVFAILFSGRRIPGSRLLAKLRK
jgi:menaquinone-9 beta-reductase